MAIGDTTNNFAPSTGSVNIGHMSGGVITQPPPARPATPPSVLSTVPFPRDPDYVERTNILNAVEQKLSFPGGRVVLWGLGGVGKSQLAIEYAHRVRIASADTWVFWLHASNASRFEQSVRDTLDQLKVASEQTVNNFRLFRSWLQESKHGRWLLIVDNADDASFLLEPPSNATTSDPRLDYLPPCTHGAILFTSRNKREALRLVDTGDNAIEVEPMDHRQASALITKKLGTQLSNTINHVELEQLTNTLDYIPLAIVLAAAYIKARAPRVSVQQYMESNEESGDGRFWQSRQPSHDFSSRSADGKSIIVL